MKIDQNASHKYHSNISAVCFFKYLDFFLLFLLSKSLKKSYLFEFYLCILYNFPQDIYIIYFRDFRLLSIGGGADEVMLSIICKYMGTLPKPPSPAKK